MRSPRLSARGLAVRPPRTAAERRLEVHAYSAPTSSRWTRLAAVHDDDLGGGSRPRAPARPAPPPARRAPAPRRTRVSRSAPGSSRSTRPRATQADVGPDQHDRPVDDAERVAGQAQPGRGAGRRRGPDDLARCARRRPRPSSRRRPRRTAGLASATASAARPCTGERTGTTRTSRPSSRAATAAAVARLRPRRVVRAAAPPPARRPHGPRRAGRRRTAARRRPPFTTDGARLARTAARAPRPPRRPRPRAAPRGAAASSKRVTRDARRAAGVDARLEGGADVVDVHVDVEHAGRGGPAADHDDAVAEPAEHRAQAVGGGLVRARQQVLHLVRVLRAARLARGDERAADPRRRRLDRVGALLAGHDRLERAQQHHPAPAARVDHARVAQRGQLVGGAGQRGLGAPRRAARTTPPSPSPAAAACCAAAPAAAATVRSVPSTGSATAARACSAPRTSPAASARASARGASPSASDTPRSSWDSSTPELPRAPMQGAVRHRPRRGADVRGRAVARARPPRRDSTVSSRLVPVSPSGTG